MPKFLYLIAREKMNRGQGEDNSKLKRGTTSRQYPSSAFI